MGGVLVVLVALVVLVVLLLLARRRRLRPTRAAPRARRNGVRRTAGRGPRRAVRGDDHMDLGHRVLRPLPVRADRSRGLVSRSHRAAAAIAAMEQQ